MSILLLGLSFIPWVAAWWLLELLKRGGRTHTLVEARLPRSSSSPDGTTIRSNPAVIPVCLQSRTSSRACSDKSPGTTKTKNSSTLNNQSAALSVHGVV